MKTIYIKGKGQYKKSIRKALSKSSLKEGSDYIEGNSLNDSVLIWINKNLDFRKFKLAITPKCIWKHRLKFFNSIDEMNPNIEQEITLTKTDLALLDLLKHGKNL